VQAEVAEAKTRFDRAREGDGEDGFGVVARGVVFHFLFAGWSERASVVEGLLGVEARH
jgi:hypothetical protein